MKLPKPNSQWDEERVSKRFYCANSSVVIYYNILKGWVTLSDHVKLDPLVAAYDGWVECDRKGNKIPPTKHYEKSKSLASSISATIRPEPKLSSYEKNKGATMATLNKELAEDFDYDDEVVSIDEANAFAASTAREAVNEYIRITDEKTNKGPIMANNEINDAAEAVKQETLLSAKLVSGEILLDNIETIADKLVLGRLNWFQKLTINKKQKELAVTLATYAIVHAIRTGGFGLTKYRIDHAALGYVTLAANQRMVKYLVSTVGIDTNLAAMFLKVPEVTTVQ